MSLDQEKEGLTGQEASARTPADSLDHLLQAKTLLAECRHGQRQAVRLASPLALVLRPS